MSLIVSASLNANGNPQIYGSDTFQNGSGQPVVANALVHRVIVEKTATGIQIFIGQNNSSKTVNNSATASANTSALSSIAGYTGLTAIYNGTTRRFEITGNNITPSQAVPVYEDNFYHDDSSGGINSIYGSLVFVYTDTTTESHTLFITSNEAIPKIIQSSCTNTISLSYQDALYDYQNPLDNWGAIDKGKVKYEYSLDAGTTWLLIDLVDTMVVVSKTFDDAYTGILFRATRTVFDVNNNIIYESISSNLIGAGNGWGNTSLSSFDIAECIPTLSQTVSDIYCGCTKVDIVDSTNYQNRKNWLVGVYTRNIVDGTPYYRGSEIGNKNNQLEDNLWSIFIPFNGDYTFKVIAVKKYFATTTYSQNDWVFNSIDGRMYVSVSNANVGNSLSSLVSWRLWKAEIDLETVFIKSVNGAAGTYLQNTLTKTITCNSEKPVQIRNKKSCESSCSTIVFEDVTGNFDFATNPYGYGLPHYNRNQYANVYFLINKKSDGSVLSYKPSIYNYLSGMSPMFDIPKDGWYRLYLYQVEIYDASKRYKAKAIVYNESLNAFFKSLIANNIYPLTNNQAWVSVSTWEEFRDNTTYDNYQWDQLVTCNSQKTLNDIGLAIISDKCNGSCQDVLLKKYYLMRIYLSGACEARDVYNYESAQCLLESIPKNCAPYIGDTKGGCGGC